MGCAGCQDGPATPPGGGNGPCPGHFRRSWVVSGLIIGQLPEAKRRSDAGRARPFGRDITGLLLTGEHYAVQYDLLATALGVQPARLRGIVARWRNAGLVATGTLGPGPAWCWLTAAGISACGLAYPARPPALSRLAHSRAVLAARLWLQAGQAWADGQAWWRPERKIRASLQRRGRAHRRRGDHLASRPLRYGWSGPARNTTCGRLPVAQKHLCCLLAQRRANVEVTLMAALPLTPALPG